MATIDTLKRDLRRFRTVTLSMYDKLNAGQTVRDRFAINIDNRTLRENPVRLDEEFFFPMVYSWLDEPITMNDIDTIQWTVPMKGYGAALPYNRVNIGRPNTIAKLDRLTPRLPEGLLRKQTQLVLEVFRRSPTAYDGQPFFNNAHQHPGGKGLANNIVDLPFADPAVPTTDEVKELIHEVRARFTSNLTIQSEIIDAEALDQGLVVVVHNEKHLTQFNKVRTMTRIDDKENELFRSFRLLKDLKPTAGQENHVEFQAPSELAPPPAWLIIDTNPELDALDNTNRVPEGYVAIVFDQIMGVKPAYWQGSIQGRP